MGRKKKGSELEDRLKKYLEIYELDELNSANDLESLRQLCQYEINARKLQERIDSLNPTSQTSEIKNLTQALQTTTQARLDVEKSLGIDRQRRQSESEESPQAYIFRLQSQAKEYMQKRLKVLKCPQCNILLAKYLVYVTEDGEKGAIAYEGKEIKPVSFTFSVECSKCHNICTVNNETKART